MLRHSILLDFISQISGQEYPFCGSSLSDFLQLLSFRCTAGLNGDRMSSRLDMKTCEETAAVNTARRERCQVNGMRKVRAMILLHTDPSNTILLI
jgi:hypothetical protein